MANNVDRGLYQTPLGLEADAATQDDGPMEIEVEGEDPEGESGAVTVVIGSSLSENDPDNPFNDNLVEVLDDSEITRIASDIGYAVDNDLASRKDWEKTYTDGIQLLGLQYEERTQPWAGACGVFHPMITEAVVRFQSETITETFPAAGPVKTKIIGKETPEKKESAARVAADMNYQLTERMIEYRAEHEKMLWSLPATGSAFKKVYYDPNFDRQVSLFVPAEDIILPYGTADIQTCHRVTHRMRKTKNDIVKLQQAGFYIDVEIGEPTHDTDDVRKAKDEETGFSDLNDEYFELYESHIDLDIKGLGNEDDDSTTGIALPYVVTMIKNSNTVLAIRRNWKEDDDKKLKRQHFVHYQYIPGFGSYGFGLFHLIGGFAKSATSLMRQLVDAGTLSNLPGGLKTKGLRIAGEDTPISPGEFRDVSISSGNLRDNILPLPYKEPSQTLLALLTGIVEEGRRFAATADMKVSDMSAQSPVGTTLALLERQLKVMTAIQARVHYAMKQELKLIAGIVRDYTDDDYSYQPDTGTPRAKQSDYDSVDIIPVSDPNAATLSQRVVQYQAVMQMAQMAPQIYDMAHLHRSMLDVLGVKEADKLVPIPDDMKPKDPMAETMAVLNGTPVKAFMHQDHESHIKFHMAVMQDPIIMQLVGQNPRAPQMQAAATAHIAEHVGYAYRLKLEQQLGIPLPSEDEKLPPQYEYALSGMMAQAAQQVLQQSKSLAAQQQAQKNAQDPLIQIQQQELALKAKEVEIKGAKLAADTTIAKDKLDLEMVKVDRQSELEGVKLGIQIKKDKSAADAQLQAEGMRIGADMAKSKSQQALEARRMHMEMRKHGTTQALGISKVLADVHKHENPQPAKLAPSKPGKA